MACGRRARRPDADAGDHEDAEFARLVKEWTTKPEFSSPLVDASAQKRQGVPTPKDVLGYYIGEPKKLTYTADQQAYFRRSRRRCRGACSTIVAGTAEEGRDILVVFISLGGQPQEPRDESAEPAAAGRPARPVARPRPQRLIASTKPHYHMSAGLHSAETNPPEAVIELAYRLAVSEEPYIRRFATT